MNAKFCKEEQVLNLGEDENENEDNEKDIELEGIDVLK